MEKFLEAAMLAWNPIGEVRKRLIAGSLTVSAVLIPAIAAVVACNLFRIAASDFFWDTALHASNPNLEKVSTSTFVVEFVSGVSVLVAVAALALVPIGVFQPHGRSAVAAAVLVVLAADAFYSAAVMAPLYFVAGSFSYDDFQQGERIFNTLARPLALAVLALTLFFWGRVVLSVLGFGAARLVAITLVLVVAILGLFGLLVLATNSTSVFFE